MARRSIVFRLCGRCPAASRAGANSRVAGEGPSSSGPSSLAVFEAVFPVDRLPVRGRKQTALGLGQMEIDGSGLTAGGQQLLDVVHVRGGLVLVGQLLKRD